MYKKYISVAIATYNGEKYIEEQLRSILLQLGDNDEIIVSDDGSTDKTIDIIKSFNDSRIKILEGPHNGVKQNFSNAINHCTGKYIFLSDQDDIWLPTKVLEVTKIFNETSCSCVVHDADVVNGDLSKVTINSFFAYRKSKNGIVSNIYKNRYLGCCMAFTNELKKYIIPIPNNIEMHDQWIGIVAEIYGKSFFLNKKLIHYRRHDNNVSSMNHFPLKKMISNRLNLIKELLKRKKFIKKEGI